MTASTRPTFEDLVRQAEALITSDDRAILRTYGKDEAVSRLHLTLGARIREALSLWNEDASIKLDAIQRHANQGMFMGYDADGASGALLEYLWDKVHGG